MCTILIQGYQSQLKWIATQTHVTSTDKATTHTTCNPKSKDDIHSARCVLLAWEEAQFIAMSLVKYSGSCTLYKSWCAFATIQHWNSCNLLLDLTSRKEEHENDINDSEETKKLQQKITIVRA